MQNTDPVVIVAVARTPMGAFQGELAGFTASDLGKVAIEEALQRSGLKAVDIEDVIMGCVLSAGQGQAPARQAALKAGLPEATGATTINKMCGSGMRAVMFAHDSLLAGSSNIMIAGGMESMTNAPYILDRARSGYRMGHAKMYDHMMMDGLEDAYEKGQSMGVFADDTARKLQITRDDQDKFALASLTRALRAANDGDFASEIAVLKVK
ncbi:MAG: acetyl-CoA C-acetyltransferase, partial [Proteobacteria bacterium]|nr:acetyl-CoA C-acetyltransferase [Pseudomonadota bacterium]